MTDKKNLVHHTAIMDNRMMARGDRPTWYRESPSKDGHGDWTDVSIHRVGFENSAAHVEFIAGYDEENVFQTDIFIVGLTQLGGITVNVPGDDKEENTPNIYEVILGEIIVNGGLATVLLAVFDALRQGMGEGRSPLWWGRLPIKVPRFLAKPLWPVKRRFDDLRRWSLLKGVHALGKLCARSRHLFVGR